MDRAMAMRDGRIVEAGSHDKLLRQPGGLYARVSKSWISVS